MHRGVFAAVVAVCLLFVTGCGGSHYPEPKVTTAVGRPGACASCQEPIDLVGEEHLVTIGPSRFVVCDETCEAALRSELKGQ